MSAENNFRLIAPSWRLNSFRLRLENNPRDLSPWNGVAKTYSNLTEEEQSKWTEIAHYIGPLNTCAFVSELMDRCIGNRPEIITIMEKAATHLRNEANVSPTSVESLRVPEPSKSSR